MGHSVTFTPKRSLLPFDEDDELREDGLNLPSTRQLTPEASCEEKVFLKSIKQSKKKTAITCIHTRKFFFVIPFVPGSSGTIPGGMPDDM